MPCNSILESLCQSPDVASHLMDPVFAGLDQAYPELKLSWIQSLVSVEQQQLFTSCKSIVESDVKVLMLLLI